MILASNLDDSKSLQLNNDCEANPTLIVLYGQYHRDEWRDLTWSSIGDKIALVGAYNLFVMNADGSEVIEITQRLTGQHAWNSPSWSPDGQTIIAGVSDHQGDYIWVMNADGSNRTIIADHGRYPALSSDGSKIAFHRRDGLYVMNIDGSNQHLILSSNDTVFGDYTADFGYLDWSPDDSKIASVVGERRQIDNRWYGNTSIWIIDSDGSNPTRVFHGGGGGFAYPNVQWSPDSSKIIYGLGVRGALGGVYVMNSDGSNKTVLIQGAVRATYSSDGNKMLFYEGGHLYMLDLREPYSFPPDTDCDGMPDSFERNWDLDLFNASDATEDSFDNDGLTNLEEYIHNTNLKNPDTDDDGLSDGLEVHIFETDPKLKDTDNNGLGDGLEAAAAGFNAKVTMLSKNWISVQIAWSNHTLNVVSNSSVVGLTFNSTNTQLTVNVAGTEGTKGFCNITLPQAVIPTSSNIQIYLDNQPLDFSLTDDTNNYHIAVQYTHSTHVLMMNIDETIDTSTNFTVLIVAGMTVIIIFTVTLLMMIRRKKSRLTKTTIFK